MQVIATSANVGFKIKAPEHLLLLRKRNLQQRPQNVLNVKEKYPLQWRWNQNMKLLIHLNIKDEDETENSDMYEWSTHNEEMESSSTKEACRT